LSRPARPRKRAAVPRRRSSRARKNPASGPLGSQSNETQTTKATFRYIHPHAHRAAKSRNFLAPGLLPRELYPRPASVFLAPDLPGLRPGRLALRVRRAALVPAAHRIDALRGRVAIAADPDHQEPPFRRGEHGARSLRRADRPAPRRRPHPRPALALPRHLGAPRRTGAARWDDG